MDSCKEWVQIGALSLGVVALHVPAAADLATVDTPQTVFRSAREYNCAPERKTLPPGDAKTQAEAMRIATRSSISKAIALAGFARLELLLPHNEAADLKPFADFSHAIVTGVIRSRTCSVSANDRWVISAYTFKVDEVFKGTVSGELIVLMYGGAITFEDGTWAQMLSDRFLTPTAGERYLLFLIRSDIALGDALAKRVGPAGAFQMTQFGPGAFRLDPKGIARSVVDTQGRVMSGRNLIQTYNGQPVEQLLRDLRAALGK